MDRKQRSEEISMGQLSLKTPVRGEEVVIFKKKERKKEDVSL